MAFHKQVSDFDDVEGALEWLEEDPMMHMVDTDDEWSFYLDHDGCLNAISQDDGERRSAAEEELHERMEAGD